MYRYFRSSTHRYFVVRFVSIQNTKEQRALQRIKCDLNRNAVRFPPPLLCVCMYMEGKAPSSRKFMKDFIIHIKAEFPPKNGTSAVSTRDPLTCHIRHVIFFFFGVGSGYPVLTGTQLPLPFLAPPSRSSPLPPSLPPYNLLGHVTGLRRLPGHSRRRSTTRACAVRSRAVNPQAVTAGHPHLQCRRGGEEGERSEAWGGRIAGSWDR